MNSEDLTQYLIAQGLTPDEAKFIIITYKLNSPFKKQEYNAGEWTIETVGTPEEVLKEAVTENVTWDAVQNYIETTGYDKFAAFLMSDENTAGKYSFIEETGRLIVWQANQEDIEI